MEFLNILLLCTLLNFVYCTSEMTEIRRKILNYIADSKEMSNTNGQLEVKCEFLNYIHMNNSIMERNFKLIITGRVVSFKNIPFKYDCNGSIIIVEIFAMEKIIIDRNFNAKGKSIVFVVAAPIWQIVGERDINLNGYNGKKRRKSNAKNGSCHSKRGAHGKEGFPGGPGGQFHGIAGYIINKYNLMVHFNGGKGSNGQNGGKGTKGQDGTEFNLEVDKIHANGSVPGFRVIVQSVRKLSKKESSVGFYQISATIFGKKAQNGGKGGNGGPSGEGGLPGYYFLFDLKSSKCGNRDVIRFVDTQIGIRGEDGGYGFGGRGGEGGKPGKDVSLMLLVSKDKIDILNHTTFDHVRVESKGKNGLDGKFISRTLQLAKHYSFQIFENSEYYYKRFLKSHLPEFNDSNWNPWVRELQIALLECPFYQRIPYFDKML